MRNNAAPRHSQKNQPTLMRRFILFSIALFLIILVSGSLAFVFSMGQIIRDNKANALSQLLEIERNKLETLVNNEIVIALRLANSPLIQRYFADPAGSADLKQIVYREIEAYRFSFASGTIFWLSDADKLFHSDDDEPFVLDTTRPENYWYPMTMYETEIYNFNINYNPDLNVTNLWINAPFFGDDGRPLGILGTGINLTTFIDMLYMNDQGRDEIYFFNAAGEITGARDIALVTSKKGIVDEFGDMGSAVYAQVQSLAVGEIQTMDTAIGKAAFGRVPTLGWYVLVLQPDSIEDYMTSMTGLFLVVIGVIALIFVIFNIFIASILKPLRKTMASLEVASQAKSDFLSNMSH